MIQETFSASAIAAGSAGGADPFARLILFLALILVLAMIAGDLSRRLKQPAVLGELILGMILGNLGLAGIHGLEDLKSSEALETLARLGVLILLFEVGLESTVGQMAKVGLSSFLVAVAGVAMPFALGWAVGIWLLPDASPYVHAFLGATLTATSVGITARVLKDIGRSGTAESRVILGAAVIDDILGLIILAAVSGMIAAADQGRAFSIVSIGAIAGKAVLFLSISLTLGLFLSPRLFSLASRLSSRGVLLACALGFCFFLAWLARLIGLEPIVGAFAAGLILEEAHFRDLVAKGEKPLEESLEPIATFLVPVFFVLMGIRTDLRAFADPGILVLAGVLTAAAIAGKLACSLGVLGKGIDRLSVGIGMVPRGEVGLIFANIGLSLSVGGQQIITPSIFSAVVVMVMVTTFVTPPALKWSLARKGQG